MVSRNRNVWCLSDYMARCKFCFAGRHGLGPWRAHGTETHETLPTYLTSESEEYTDMVAFAIRMRELGVSDQMIAQVSSWSHAYNLSTTVLVISHHPHSQACVYWPSVRFHLFIHVSIWTAMLLYWHHDHQEISTALQSTAVQGSIVPATLVRDRHTTDFFSSIRHAVLPNMAKIKNPHAVIKW